VNKDQDDLDSMLPWAMSMIIENILELIGGLIMICAILPIIIIILLVSLIFYVRLIGYHMLGTREIKRIEANNRTPILTSF